MQKQPRTTILLLEKNVKSTTNKNAKKEEVKKLTLDNNSLKLKNEELELNNKSLRYNIHARKSFSWAIFCLVFVWLIAVICITIFAGLKKLELDKSVLVALITSGSVNVIGLFSYVAKYLYHVSESHTSAVSEETTKPKEIGSKDTKTGEG